MDRDTVDALRAIEALRAGVPNRDVVRQLQPSQPDIERRFAQMLSAAEAGLGGGKAPGGMLIEGDFGTGKSHWLEYLRHLAIEAGFVCSSVVLSKETPLHDLSKLYRACVESAVAPGRVGPALEEIALTPLGDQHTADLYRWIESNPDVDPRFAATLYLFQQTADAETRQRILAEWTGYPMKVSDLRAALGATAEGSARRIARALKSQALQRFEFLSRFFRSAGYPGWVLLIDEMEMVSTYSLRQRGRSYAHLAWLSGAVPDVAIPGLASVFTITKDYAGEVLRGRKYDIENVPARLEGTRDDAYIQPAEQGMALIEGRGRRPLDLRPLGRAEVDETYHRVTGIYSRAYGWEAPEIERRREYLTSTSMREYIRSWITIWDLKRLYGHEADIVTERITLDYGEDADMQDEEPAGPGEPEIVL